MHVRPAMLADLGAILAIYNEAVLTTTASADTEPQTLAARAAWYEGLRREGYPVRVAVSEREVVGWAALMPYKPRPGYRFTAETSLYVAERARGQGVGKALLAELMAEAGRRPLRNLIAAISGDNEASLRLHRNFGFTDGGTLTAAVYKFDTWIDVVLLQCEIPGWQDRVIPGDDAATGSRVQ
ncbi:MAG: GNAT family N-acetyltransferase [Fimbriimonas sp.]